MKTASSSDCISGSRREEYKLPLFLQQIAAVCGFILVVFAIVKIPSEFRELSFSPPKDEQAVLHKKARLLSAQVDEMTGLGCLQGDCQFGNGRYVKVDGTVYEGSFVAGRYEGSGVLVFPTTAKTDIEYYAGEFLMGHPSGQGFIQYADGSRYQGEVSNLHRHGYGKYYDATSGTWMEGKWNNDRLEQK